MTSQHCGTLLRLLHERDEKQVYGSHTGLTFPQNGQKYLLCWLTSIFLICFRRLAPYRVPYLPTMPTFFVRFDCGGIACTSQQFASDICADILKWNGAELLPAGLD